LEFLLGPNYTDHYDTAMEFILTSQAETTFQQTPASLTTNPARRFGDSDRTGRIAVAWRPTW
jgi:hypothetical protein